MNITPPLPGSSSPDDSSLAPIGVANLPASVWVALLNDVDTQERYRARVHRRQESDCWYWLGSLSSSGHGKLRAGSRSRETSRVVTAHVYGYQLVHGVIAREPGADLVVAHLCDESACQNPAHWELVERGVNNTDYSLRRHRRGDHPLADTRGRRGRAAAIRDAILAAQKENADIDSAIWSARTGGIGSADQTTLW